MQRQLATAQKTIEVLRAENQRLLATLAEPSTGTSNEAEAMPPERDLAAHQARRATAERQLPQRESEIAEGY